MRDFSASEEAWDPSDLVQDPKMGIPEKCWQKWGSWHRCWQKWGCWPECWHRCWQVGPFGITETKQLASTCASTPASTPIFASTCASTPASTFLEFPFWGPVPGHWDLKGRHRGAQFYFMFAVLLALKDRSSWSTSLFWSRNYLSPQQPLHKESREMCVKGRSLRWQLHAWIWRESTSR